MVDSTRRRTLGPQASWDSGPLSRRPVVPEWLHLQPEKRNPES
jgi:hypothetical protein